jgi:hypothetical protein
MVRSQKVSGGVNLTVHDHRGLEHPKALIDAPATILEASTTYKIASVTNKQVQNRCVTALIKYAARTVIDD